MDNNTQETGVYSDGRIAIIDKIKDINQPKSVKIEDFVLLLCLKGKATIYINDELHEVRPGDMLIAHPNTILENGMTSIDIEIRCIALSIDYVKQLAMMEVKRWEVICFFEKSPILQLQPDEVESFCQYYDLLRSKLSGPAGKHHKEMMDSLLQAFLYNMADTLSRFAPAMQPQSYNSSERLFKHFIEILSSSYPKPRSVTDYAQRLNVSPKYLSAVCKEVSGHTASELINNYVMKDVYYLLKEDKATAESPLFERYMYDEATAKTEDAEIKMPYNQSINLYDYVALYGSYDEATTPGEVSVDDGILKVSKKLEDNGFNVVYTFENIKYEVADDNKTDQSRFINLGLLHSSRLRSLILQQVILPIRRKSSMN